MQSSSNQYMMDASSLKKAEQWLVQGCFRKSLEQSNALLRTCHEIAGRDVDLGDVADVKRLQTSVSLFDNSDANSQKEGRYIVLNWRKESDHVDRVAAVALQSWYELVTRQQQNAPNQQEKQLRTLGRPHLQPVIERYTTEKNPSVMSPELLVVLVQFCHAMDYFTLAVELASEAIHWYRHQSDTISTTGLLNSHFIELFELLFFDFLPRCEDAAKEEEKRFIGESPWRSCGKQWIPSTNPRAEALHILLSSFLTSSGILCNENDWLVPIVLKCRNKWQAQLLELEEIICSSDEQSCSIEVGPPSGHISNLLLSKNDQQKSWRLLAWPKLNDTVRRLLVLLQQVPLTLQDPSRRNEMALTLLSLWITLRFRRKVAAMSLSAFRSLIWKPATEIVEALVPRPSR
jgi:hypothetical protein